VGDDAVAEHGMACDDRGQPVAVPQRPPGDDDDDAARAERFGNPDRENRSASQQQHDSG
jgi:hypothetical protein